MEKRVEPLTEVYARNQVTCPEVLGQANLNPLRKFMHTSYAALLDILAVAAEWTARGIRNKVLKVPRGLGLELGHM